MKKILKRVLSGAIALTMLFGMTGCRTIAVQQYNNGNPFDWSLFGIHWTPNGNTTQVVNGETFDEFCDRLFKETLEADAWNAHFMVNDLSKYGVSFTEEDYSMGEFSMEDEAEAYKETQEELDQLTAYTYDELNDEQKLTYDCLKQYIETSLAYEGTSELQQAFAPSSGLIANLSTNFTEYVFRNEDDVKNYLIYMASVPKYMEGIYAFTRQQAADGYFMYAMSVDETIDQCDAYLEAELNPYIETFNEKVEALGLSDAAVADYEAQNLQAVNTYITPVYEDSKALMLELHDAGQDIGGLCNYGTEGMKYYAAIVKNKTSSNMLPNDVKNLLDKALQDVFQELVDVYMNDPDTYYAFYDYELDETKYGTPDDCLQFILLNINDAFAKEVFPTIVTDQYHVQYLNPACEVDGTLAYYVTAPIDDVYQNSIKVNGSGIAGDTMNLYTTIAHEGYPGHLYQFTSFYANENVSNVRKVLDFIGYTEGWAQYASDCAVEYLDLSDNMKQMVKVNSLLGYILSARVDVGVNYEGWSKEETMRFLSDYYDLTEEDVDNFYYSVIADPGLLLPYTTGHLMMRNARARAEQAKGSDFDVEKFHEFIIKDVGIVPFNVFDDRFNVWLSL